MGKGRGKGQGKGQGHGTRSRTASKEETRTTETLHCCKAANRLDDYATKTADDMNPEVREAGLAMIRQAKKEKKLAVGVAQQRKILDDIKKEYIDLELVVDKPAAGPPAPALRPPPTRAFMRLRWYHPVTGEPIWMSGPKFDRLCEECGKAPGWTLACAERKSMPSSFVRTDGEEDEEEEEEEEEDEEEEDGPATREPLSRLPVPASACLPVPACLPACLPASSLCSPSPSRPPPSCTACPPSSRVLHAESEKRVFDLCSSDSEGSPAKIQKATGATRRGPMLLRGRMPCKQCAGAPPARVLLARGGSYSPGPGRSMAGRSSGQARALKWDGKTGV